MVSTKIAQTVLLGQLKGLPELSMRNVLKWHLLKHWVKFKIISQKFASWCSLLKLDKWFCSTKKGAARALDKKYLQKKSSEPLVQNHNNYTEMVLMLSSTKIGQKVQLSWTTWLLELKIEISLNHISLATGQYIIYSCARTQVRDSCFRIFFVMSS